MKSSPTHSGELSQRYIIRAINDTIGAGTNCMTHTLPNCRYFISGGRLTMNSIETMIALGVPESLLYR